MPNIKDLAIKEPKAGDVRKVKRIFKKDTILSFKDDPEKYRLPYDVTMYIDEIFTLATNKYGQDAWLLKSYYTGSAEPIPTRWQRFMRWLHVPAPTLPTAKIVKE